MPSCHVFMFSATCLNVCRGFVCSCGSPFLCSALIAFLCSVSCFFSAVANDPPSVFTAPPAPRSQTGSLACPGCGLVRPRPIVSGGAGGSVRWETVEQRVDSVIWDPHSSVFALWGRLLLICSNAPMSSGVLSPAQVTLKVFFCAFLLRSGSHQKKIETK